MFRIYTASKLRQAQMWQAIHDSHPDVYFHARWLKHTGKLKTPDTPENAKRFWIEDEQDVKHADAVFVFAEDDEHLRGALVEAGMAIAYGKPVYVIGEHPDYGTWQYHPAVVRVRTVEEAIAHYKEFAQCIGF